MSKMKIKTGTIIAPCDVNIMYYNDPYNFNIKYDYFDTTFDKLIVKQNKLDKPITAAMVIIDDRIGPTRLCII
jgi:hypothetical protein